MISKEIHEYFVAMGKKGGKATLKKRGKEYFKQIRKKSTGHRRKKLSTDKALTS